MGKVKRKRSKWRTIVILLLGAIGVASWRIILDVIGAVLDFISSLFVEEWLLLILICVLGLTIVLVTRKLWRKYECSTRLRKRLLKMRTGIARLKRPVRTMGIIGTVFIAILLLFYDIRILILLTLCIVGSWALYKLFKRLIAQLTDNGQRKFRFRDLPLRVSYVVYVVVAMLLATLFCACIIKGIDAWRIDLYQNYLMRGEEHVVPPGGRIDMNYVGGNDYQFNVLDEREELVDQFVVNFNDSTIEYLYDNRYSAQDTSQSVHAQRVYWYEDYNVVAITPIYSEVDQFWDLTLKVLSSLCIPIVYVGAIVWCAVMFYRDKLRRPIELLADASARIAENSLDFHIEYDLRDEMGQLCDSFETMREALMRNNAEMWRQMEERRRLNAAFSHDLRTPLTVLKGHADMLLSGVPDGSIDRTEILQEVSAMSANIGRLENYVAAMSRLQRLEDVEIHAETVVASQLIQSLRESAEILCDNKQLFFEASPATFWQIDPEVVMQVFENIVVNAVRYAATTVTIGIEEHSNEICITISDDGPGFSPTDLQKATEPFYRAEGVGGNHLGLGLNICRILCQRHGGDITLENGASGGGVVRVRFRFS